MFNYRNGLYLEHESDDGVCDLECCSVNIHSGSFINKPVILWFPRVCFVVVIVEKHVDEIQTHFEKERHV